jgi:hypothetical protein
VTPVLLDTNAYLRLAKRIRPLLGKPFGQKAYVLGVLRDVDDEVHRSPRLRSNYPWFDMADLASERKTYSPRLTQEEKEALNAATSVLLGLVQLDALQFMKHGRSPPSRTDCRVLAFGQIRPAVVVTDDLGMHLLADMVGIDNVWHGHELLKKMLSAKAIGNDLVREIYSALEVNRDLPPSWVQAKQASFNKVFGKGGD